MNDNTQTLFEIDPNYYRNFFEKNKKNPSTNIFNYTIRNSGLHARKVVVIFVGFNPYNYNDLICWIKSKMKPVSFIISTSDKKFNYSKIYNDFGIMNKNIPQLKILLSENSSPFWTYCILEWKKAKFISDVDDKNLIYKEKINNTITREFVPIFHSAIGSNDFLLHTINNKEFFIAMNIDYREVFSRVKQHHANFSSNSHLVSSDNKIYLYRDDYNHFLSYYKNITENDNKVISYNFILSLLFNIPFEPMYEPMEIDENI